MAIEAPRRHFARGTELPPPGTNQRPVVLLTGASTGIGLATVKSLRATNRYHIVATARRGSISRFARAGILSSDTLWIRPLDVREQTDRQELIRELDNRLGGVDVLINNAGISYRSVLEHVNSDEHHEQMEVNYVGPMALIRLVLPAMRARGRGHIINVSSAGGFMAMPTMGAYAASKFALEGATESLYYEVKPFGITVTLVLPGFVHSDAVSKVRLTGMGRESLNNSADPYHQHYIHMKHFVRRWSAKAWITPADVASKICRVAQHPPSHLRIPATPETHLLWWFRRLTPQRIYHALLYRLLPGIKFWGKTNALPSPLHRPKLDNGARSTKRASAARQTSSTTDSSSESVWRHESPPSREQSDSR